MRVWGHRFILALSLSRKWESHLASRIFLSSCQLYQDLSFSLIRVLPAPVFCDTWMRRCILLHKFIFISPLFHCPLLRHFKSLAFLLLGEEWAWWAVVNHRLAVFWGVAMKCYKHTFILIAFYSAGLWACVPELSSFAVYRGDHGYY